MLKVLDIFCLIKGMVLFFVFGFGRILFIEFNCFRDENDIDIFRR